MLASARTLVRTWRGRFIVGFLLAQLLLPLHYYLGHRDPHDERFAWRMFSPIRMVQCTPRFTLAGKPLDPLSEFHEAWSEIAARGRFVVIEAMGKALCERHPNTAVTVDLDCQYLDQSSAHFGGYDMCRVPQL
jgi:hypothetical protein